MNTPASRNQEVQTTEEFYFPISQDEQQNLLPVVQNTVLYKCGFCEKYFESREKYTQHIRDEHMLHLFCCKQKEVNFFNCDVSNNKNAKSVETQTPEITTYTNLLQPSTSNIQAECSLPKTKSVVDILNNSDKTNSNLVENVFHITTAADAVSEKTIDSNSIACNSQAQYLLLKNTNDENVLNNISKMKLKVVEKVYRVTSTADIVNEKTTDTVNVDCNTNSNNDESITISNKSGIKDSSNNSEIKNNSIGKEIQAFPNVIDVEINSYNENVNQGQITPNCNDVDWNFNGEKGANILMKKREISSCTDNSQKSANNDAKSKSQLINPDHLQELVQIHSFVGAYQVIGSSLVSQIICLDDGNNALDYSEEQEQSEEMTNELDIVPSCFYNIPDHAYYSKTIFNMPDELITSYFKPQKKKRSWKKKVQTESIQPSPVQLIPKQIMPKRPIPIQPSPIQIISTQPLPMEPYDLLIEPERESELDLSVSLLDTVKSARRRSNRITRKSTKYYTELPQEAPPIPKVTFVCDYCEAEFLFSKALSEHVKKTHTNHYQKITCAKCDEEFINVRKMQHHIKSRSHYIGWYCYPCRNRFYKLEDFWKHGCKYKNSKSFIYIDMRKFYTKEREIWQCDICKELFFAKKVLQNHISKCCLLCDICDLAFYEAMPYIDHKARCKTGSLEENVEKNNMLNNECLVHCKYCTRSFTQREIDEFVSHVENCSFKTAAIKLKNKRTNRKLEEKVWQKRNDLEQPLSENSEILVEELDNETLARHFEMNLDCAEFVEEEFRTDSRSSDPTTQFFQSLNLQPALSNQFTSPEKRSNTKMLRSMNVSDRRVLSPELQPSCSVEKLNITNTELGKSPRSLKSTEPQFKIVDVRTCDEYFSNESMSLQSPDYDQDSLGSARRKLWPDCNNEQASEIEPEDCCPLSEKESNKQDHEINIAETDYIPEYCDKDSNSLSVQKLATTTLASNSSSTLKVGEPTITSSPVETNGILASLSQSKQLCSLPTSPGVSAPAPQVIKIPQSAPSFKFITKISANSEKMVLKTKKGKLIDCYFRQRRNYVCCKKCGHWVKSKLINKHPCHWIKKQLIRCHVKLTDVKKTGAKNLQILKEASAEMEIIRTVAKAYSRPKTNDDNQLLSISKEINAGAAYTRLVSLRKHVRKSYAELPEVIDKIEAELPENFTYTYWGPDGSEKTLNKDVEVSCKTRASIKIAEWKKKWALKKPKTRRRHAVKRKAIYTANLKLSHEDDFKQREKQIEDGSSKAGRVLRGRKNDKINKTDDLKSTSDISESHSGVLELETKNEKNNVNSERERTNENKQLKTIVGQSKSVNCSEKNQEIQKELVHKKLNKEQEGIGNELFQSKKTLQQNEQIQKDLQWQAHKVNTRGKQLIADIAPTVTQTVEKNLMCRDYTRKRKASPPFIDSKLKKIQKDLMSLPDTKQLKLYKDKQSGEKRVIRTDITPSRCLRTKKPVHYFRKRSSKDPEDKTDEKEPAESTETMVRMVTVEGRPIAKVKPMAICVATTCEKTEETFKTKRRVGDKKENPKSRQKIAEKTHKRGYFRKEKFNCSVCAKHFTNNELCRNHTREHAKTHPYVCNVCGKCFNNVNTLTLHVQRSNRLEVKSCDVCVIQFCSKAKVEKHMKLHEVG